ncbi:MAG: hypothetical protein B0W54_11880 [Cellvibrio sp. 79]|nr:MAG: hypothetical protein B0W54_11880 [Cellvibrio sp. 79]
MKIVWTGKVRNRCMERPTQFGLLILILFSLLKTTPTHAGQPNSRLDAYQDFFAITHITDENSARAFLVDHATRYQLNAPESPDSLRLSAVKPSLNSQHYHFQQRLNGIDVDRAGIIVSVDAQSKKVIRVFNDTRQVLHDQTVDNIAANKKTTASKPTIISASVALEKIWKQQVSGSQLSAKPQVRLVYRVQAGLAQLVYRINLSTNQQPGNWEYTLNAHTGEILTIERLDAPAFMPRNFQRTRDPSTLNDNNPDTYSAALAKFTTNNNLRKKTINAQNRTNGTALVFDPDPITALQNLDLSIHSPLNAFEAAYVARPLNDISVSNGIYSLDGPWVKIENRETPDTTISTTSNGDWRAKRNESAFQDAMAYFHIDQSQRYIQSLGFNEEHGVQYGPISVDPQGLFGIHNALYNSAENSISLGVAEDCPAAAEDADVILHEYGHAIHFSINPDWYGGDVGAMGEGFADYWAGSYSLTTTNGAHFHPERMAPWVSFNSCWQEGRLLTRTDARYSPGKIYDAHEKVGNHFSDELWSAPLFHSLRTLMAQGVAREDVDRIILEAQFGLGSALTMPEMAKAIVITAQQLYPQGKHAEVFRNSFIQQKILPESISFGEADLAGSTSANTVLPGTVVGLVFPLHNNSTQTITNIAPQITSTTPNVTLLAPDNLPLDVEAGSQAQLNVKAQIAADAQCGDNLEFITQLAYIDPQDGQQKNIAHKNSYLIGEPIITRTNAQPNVKIASTGNVITTSTLQLEGLPINPLFFKLHLDLRIPTSSLPEINLISPSGTRIPLVSISRFSSELNGSAPDNFGYRNMFAPLAGENPNGIWTLEIKQPLDHPRDGLLKSWGISTVTGANCSSATTIAPLTLNGIHVYPDMLPLGIPSTGTTGFSRGSLLNINYLLRNNAVTELSDINVRLASTVNIAAIKSTITPGKLAPLSTHKGLFNFKIPDDANCGSTIPLTLNYSYSTTEGIIKKEINTQITAGSVFVSRTGSDGTPQDIPDNFQTGITATFFVERQKAFDAKNIKFVLNLEHTNPADLTVLLRSPQGTEIELIKSGTHLPIYINDKFPDDLTSATPLSRFNNENPNGIWTLTVVDTKPGNTGTFGWIGMETHNELDCAPNNNNRYPTALLEKNQYDIVEGETITIDASVSNDMDGDELGFSYEQMKGPTHPLINDTTSKPQFTAPTVSEPTGFTYTLTVTDYYGARSEAAFSINVKKAVVASSSSSSPTQTGKQKKGGGNSSLLLIGLLALGFVYRAKKTVC